MWMLPVHGFARRRKAHIGRNETPLILVYAGGGGGGGGVGGASPRTANTATPATPLIL